MDPILSTDYVMVHYKSASGQGKIDVNPDYIKQVNDLKACVLASLSFIVGGSKMTVCY